MIIHVLVSNYYFKTCENFEISLLFSRRTVHKNLISLIIASVNSYVCRFRVDLPYDASHRCFGQFLVSGAVLMLECPSCLLTIASLIDMKLTFA